MKLRKERSIVAVYDAVSISKDIEVSGGPLTLNFYAESRSYIPNRFITPIILTPKIYVVDPNKVIADGDKHSELTECIWYMNGEKIVSDDAFKINKDNTLTVFKNSEKDYTISYSATWFDTRKKLNIYIEDSVQFVTIALGDGNLLPRINIDKAQNWIHNPLKGEKKYSIKAYISKDKVYEGAVEWYYNYVGKPLVLFDEKCKFYVKGLYTNELIIDSSKASNCVITAKNLSKEKLQLYYWFFDENGNPISNNEPVYKEISSKEPITLPVDTIEIAAKYNILGDTLLINNPSLLNITDEEFNKAYGINPEWDNHMEEVFGLEIGGRNLLFNSSFENGTNNWNSDDIVSEINGNEITLKNIKNGNFPKLRQTNPHIRNIKKGETYTLSFEAKGDTSGMSAVRICMSNSSNMVFTAAPTYTDDWKKYTYIFKASVDSASGIYLEFWINSSYADSINSRSFRNLKLEKGTKPTDWTPAPEDLNYRNLVVNGDFRNGDEGWGSYNMNHEQTSDGNIKLTARGKWGNFYKLIYNANKDDLMYMRVDGEGSSNYYFFKNGATGSKGIGVSSTITKHIADKPMYGVTDSSDSDFEEFIINSFSIINLTQIFGAGNEPTKEVCDAIFAHYDYIPAPEDLNYPTIKPTTIESVLLPLTINSVSSTIGGLEKSSMEIKKSLGKNEGVTATQLVQNGDFKDGTKGWNINGVTYSKIHDGLHLSTKIKYGQFLYNLDNLTVGNKYYLKIKNNCTFDKVAFFYNGFSVVSEPIKNQSTIFTSNTAKSYVGLQNLNDTGVEINFNFNYIKLINLTQTFGAGNEPSKEWCDEHFKDYFDGTLLINIPIKKEDLSQYKITNLSSLKRLGTSVDYIENGTLHKSIELINFTGNETWVKEKAYSGIRYHMVLPYRVQGELLCNNFPTYNTITDLTTITPEGFSLVKGIYDKIYFTAIDETTKPNENTQLLLLLHKPTSELLNTSGAINMKQGGTIFVENIITTDYLYNKGITLTSDYSIKLIISLTDNTSPLDINKCVIKDNIITHPDLQNGAYGTITYEYNSNTIKGLTTMKYMNVSDLLDTLWLEDIYTYKAKINPTGNITEWELVKLTDIENYEEWLSKDKLSENTLAPDGIIPGRYSTSVKYLRLYPSSLYVDFLAPTIVKDGTTKIKARAVVGTTDGIIENPSQFFKVTWLKRNIKPGQLDVVIGTGNELVIDISNKDSITIEIEELPIK